MTPRDIGIDPEIQKLEVSPNRDRFQNTPDPASAKKAQQKKKAGNLRRQFPESSR